MTTTAKQYKIEQARARLHSAEKYEATANKMVLDAEFNWEGSTDATRNETHAMIQLANNLHSAAIAATNAARAEYNALRA